MGALDLKNTARRVKLLELENKLALSALLVGSLRRQMQPLSAYCGLGTDCGSKTAKEVNVFIRQERALWERS